MLFGYGGVGEGEGEEGGLGLALLESWAFGMLWFGREREDVGFLLGLRGLSARLAGWFAHGCLKMSVVCN